MLTRLPRAVALAIVFGALMFAASVVYLVAAAVLLMAIFPGCGERPYDMQALCEAHFTPWPFRIASAVALVGFCWLLGLFHQLLRHRHA